MTKIKLTDIVIELPRIAKEHIKEFNAEEFDVGINEYGEAYIHGKGFLFTVTAEGKLWYSGKDKDINKERIAHDLDFYLGVFPQYDYNERKIKCTTKAKH